MDIDELKKHAKKQDGQSEKEVTNIILNGISLPNRQFGEGSLKSPEKDESKSKQKPKKKIKKTRESDEESSLPVPPTNLVRRRSK